MNKIIISKKEWIFVSIITFIVILFSLLPIIFAYATQGENEVFMGVPVHVIDANNHIHLALQVKEGSILTTNKFTEESIPALLFNPYHLLLGWTAAIFATNIVTVYIIWGIIFSLLFMFTLYWFISQFIEEKPIRLVSFILAAFASGLGFYWFIIKNITGYTFGSADLWITDLNNFQSIGQPHFALSLILLMLIFVFALRAFESKKTKDAVVAGILGLLLSLIHLFDIVTIAAVLFFWFIFRQIKLKKWSWTEFKNISIIGAITAPGVIYYAWVFLFNPAYAEWNALNQTMTPPIQRIISGFGLLFLFALIYIWIKRKEIFGNYELRKTRRIEIPFEHFLVVWVVVGFILIYLPINVQARFLLGLQIPLALLMGIALFNLLKVGQTSISKKNKHIEKKENTFFKYLVIAVILILSVPTSVYLTINHIHELHDPLVGRFNNVKYLSHNEIDALNWINENTDNEDVIFAPHKISNYIPAITGNKIYSGHWAQTIDFENKYAIVQSTYALNLMPDTNKLTNIDYIWHNIKTPEHRLIYSNSEVYIYEVEK